jgi:hypothetical protein
MIPLINAFGLSGSLTPRSLGHQPRRAHHREVLHMGAGSKTGSVARTNGNRAKVGLLSSIAILAILAVPASVFAGKGGGTPAPAWISLASVKGVSAASTQPKLGSSVKFAAGYPSTTKNPWVSLTCYQGSTLVYGEGGSPTSDFVLGGGASTWLSTGGAAACTAELGDLYWKGGHEYYTHLADTSFTAGG